MAARPHRRKTRRSAIDWRQVDRHAKHGGTADEIISAMRLARRVDLIEVRDRLEEAVETGHAKLQIWVRKQIDARSRRRSDGSPNLLELLARNVLGWDRPSASAQVPLQLEIAGAPERLLAMAKRLQAAHAVEMFQRAKAGH